MNLLIPAWSPRRFSGRKLNVFSLSLSLSARRSAVGRAGVGVAGVEWFMALIWLVRLSYNIETSMKK